MAFDLSNPGMSSPSQDRGAPPENIPQAADNLPAVEPGQPNNPPAAAANPTPTPPPPKEPVIKWKDVTAKPMYQGLTPEQKEQVREAYWKEVIAPKVPPDQQKVARQAFDRDTLPKDGPQASGGSVGKVLDYMLGSELGAPLGTVAGAPEAAVHLASQAVALPVEAAASLYKLATAPAGLKAKEASEAAQAVGSAMTYQPRTPQGREIANLADDIAGVVPKVADKATGWIAENPTVKRVLGPTGSEVAQGLANTAIQAIPTVLGARTAKTAVGEASPAATASRATAAANRAAQGVARAQAYIKANTSLDWDQLPEGMKKKLSEVAQADPNGLAKLKPEAIERQANLEKLKIPGTRGQIERDVEQLTREEGMSKQRGPVREIDSAQNEALNRQLDIVRRSTGAKAVTRQQIGKTIQNDALRNKASQSVKNYDRLYKEARATEPNATVKADPFYEFLEKNGEVLNPEVQHLAFLKNWLNKAQLERPAGAADSPISLSTDVGKAVAERGETAEESAEIVRRPIKLVELDDLRRKASKIASKGGTDAHYASELVRAIDDSFEQVPAAAKKWKEARDAFKAHKIEFEDQALIKKLTSNKGKSRTDRATALEDTVETVLKHSAEDIQKLEKSLKEGGSPQTQAAGKRAWANLQAGVLDYLREKASGKRQIAGEKGEKQFNSPFRDTFNELDADGKIDVLFGKAQAARLRAINKAVGDVRTKPAGRVSGSDTAARLALSRAEKLSAVPHVGSTLAAAAKIGGKIADYSEQAKQGRRVKTSQLDEAATAAKKKNKAAGGSGNTLRSIKAASGLAHRATLSEEERKKTKDKEAKERAADRDAHALKRAKAYVASQTSLDWDSLSEESQNKILSVARRDPQALVKLDRSVIERKRAY